MEIINKKMYLSIKDIQKLFGVHYVTVLRWEKQGYFKADFKNIRGRKRFSLENIEESLIKKMGKKYGKEMYKEIVSRVGDV